MAKRRGGRKGSRFAAIPVDVGMALSTLAANTVIQQELMPLDQDAYLISADLQVSINGLTAGEGPIAVGMCSDILSDAQVLEALEAAPTSEADRIAREQASRPVRRVGQFGGQSTDEVLNNGTSFKTTLKFRSANGSDLALYAHNKAAGALTTGAFVHFTGIVYLRWQ